MVAIPVSSVIFVDVEYFESLFSQHYCNNILQFREFFNQHSDAGSGTRSYLQAEEAIIGNIYWLERNLPVVTSWLNKQTDHK